MQISRKEHNLFAVCSGFGIRRVDLMLTSLLNSEAKTCSYRHPDVVVTLSDGNVVSCMPFVISDAICSLAENLHTGWKSPLITPAVYITIIIG